MFTQSATGRVSTFCLPGQQFGMHITVKRLMDCAIEATKGTSKPVSNFSDLADHLGESPQTINNWKSRGVSQSGALKAEAVFGCSPRYVRDGVGNAFASDQPRRPMFSRSPSGEGVIAHPMSQMSFETVPSITWEQLMSEDPKMGTFSAAIPDDAMAPRVRAGTECFFKTDIPARPGAGVLVRDSSGAVYLREYREAAGGAWEAHAANPAYRTLHSVTDGLCVIAVLRGVMRGWEEI